MAAGEIDRAKAKQAALQIVADVGTALHGALSFIGDRLGLFKAMDGAGPLTVEQLASRTGLSQRYLREWLNAMAAARYVEYDSAAHTYLFTPEYAAALADEESPYFVGSYFQLIQAAMTIAPKVAQAFRTGKGVTQAEYPPSMFQATERNSLPRYKYKLVRRWISAMPQVVERLNAGGMAADVGCGGGRAAIVIAKAFPKTRVVGFDVHPESIERARRNAQESGVADRVTFELANGTELPPGKFDLVTTLDVVHDAVDPVALMTAVRRALVPGGTFLMQELNVSDKVEENIRPMGKMVYSISTMYCMTLSLAQGGAGIGAAMGEPKARELATAAGFTHFRKLPVQDDFALLYELMA
jgi:2-polyprenyl-3-methyl-5-hydroxy-6-metoxy-1,4-benzoquinol methylase